MRRPERIKRCLLSTSNRNLRFLVVWIIWLYHLCISKLLTKYIVNSTWCYINLQPKTTPKSSVLHLALTINLRLTCKCTDLSCPVTLSLSEATGFLACYYSFALHFPSFHPINGKFYIIAHLCFYRGNISPFPANLNKKQWFSINFLWSDSVFCFITNLQPIKQRFFDYTSLQTEILSFFVWSSSTWGGDLWASQAALGFSFLKYTEFPFLLMLILKY